MSNQTDCACVQEPDTDDGSTNLVEETDVKFACVTDDEVDAYRIVLSVTTVSAINVE